MRLLNKLEAEEETEKQLQENMNTINEGLYSFYMKIYKKKHDNSKVRTTHVNPGQLHKSKESINRNGNDISGE